MSSRSPAARSRRPRSIAFAAQESYRRRRGRRLGPAEQTGDDEPQRPAPTLTLAAATGDHHGAAAHAEDDRRVRRLRRFHRRRCRSAPGSAVARWSWPRRRWLSRCDRIDVVHNNRPAARGPAGLSCCWSSGSGPASAHAALVGSDPADGATPRAGAHLDHPDVQREHRASAPSSRSRHPTARSWHVSDVRAVDRTVTATVADGRPAGPLQRVVPCRVGRRAPRDRDADLRRDDRSNRRRQVDTAQNRDLLAPPPFAL